MSRRRKKTRDANIDPTAPSRLREGSGGLGVFVDLINGIGTTTQGVRFAHPRILDNTECTWLYSQGLPKRIIDLLPNETLASPYTVAPLRPTLGLELLARKAGFADLSEAEEAEQALALQLDVGGAIRRAWQRARVYGRAVAVVGYPGDPGRNPFREEAPWGREINWVKVWDKREYRPASWCKEPTSSRFGLPDVYDIYDTRPRVYFDEHLSGLGLVHPSRLVELQTDDGLSFFQRVINSLSMILAGGGATASALRKLGGMIFEIDNWDHAIRADEETSRRIVRSNVDAWSSGNPMIWPKGKIAVSSPGQGALSGVDSSLYTLAWLLCADAGVPLSKLFFLIPGGFSTDESSRTNWDTTLHAARSYIETSIIALRRHTWAATLGSEYVPSHLRVGWQALKTPTTAERAEALGSFADALGKAAALTGADPDALRAALESLPEASELDLAPPVSPQAETPQATTEELTDDEIDREPWRNAEELKALFGEAVSKASLKSNRADRPQVRVPGRLTWIRGAGGKPYYLLSEIEALYAVDPVPPPPDEGEAEERGDGALEGNSGK